MIKKLNKPSDKLKNRSDTSNPNITQFDSVSYPHMLDTINENINNALKAPIKTGADQKELLDKMLKNYEVLAKISQSNDYHKYLDKSNLNLGKMVDSIEDLIESNADLSKKTIKELKKLADSARDEEEAKFLKEAKEANDKKEAKEKKTEQLKNTMITSTSAKQQGEAAGELAGNFLKDQLPKLIPKLTPGNIIKGAGLLSAGTAAFGGISSELNGEQVKSVGDIFKSDGTGMGPDGHSINPFHYAMNAGRLAGTGINDLYSIGSEALGGTGSLGSDIFDSVDSLSKSLPELGNEISKSSKNVYNSITEEFPDKLNSFGSSLGITVFDSVDSLSKSMDGYSKELNETVTKFSDKVKDIGGNVLDAGKSIWSGLKTAGKNIVDASKEGYKKGGVIGAAKSAAGTTVSEAVNLAGKTLGSVSAKFESGKSGVSTISSGKGDHGGVSYGSYQLATNNGSMSSFLSSDSAKSISSSFKGLTPGTSEFNAKYKEMSTGSNAELMEKAQHDYMQSSHFNVQANKLRDELGIDVSKESRGFQEAVWSTATQYGPTSSAIVNALKGKDLSKMSDKDKISAIQDYKSNTVDTSFKSSSENTRQSILARTKKEKEVLLAVNDISNPDIEHLRKQGMPESEIRTIASAAGVPIPKSKSKTDDEIIRIAATEITDNIKKSKEESMKKKLDDSKLAQQNTVVNNTTNNLSPASSGYNMDTLSYLSGAA